MAISSAEIHREKDRLPRGWGRFGKAIDHLAELSGPEESLLATCVALNPAFRHRSVTLVGGLFEMTKTTNVVLAATSERLLMVGTGFGGGPRADRSIAYEGLTVEPRGDTEVVLGWPDGELHIKGAAKQQLPAFVEAVRARVAT